MPTPIYQVLKEYADQMTARFHMPGHKGAFLPAPELAPLAPLDVTEIPGTGNLYEEGEPFTSAQKLWAEMFQADYCQFLTGGSTMGIHTGLSLLCRPGDKILVDRNCHRAVFNAMGLLDLEPVYMERPWLSEHNLVGPFSREDVEKYLDQHPDVKTICITSPTYAGLLSDIEGISAAVHARGGKLFVDGAHGAHLPFLHVDAFRGADCVVVSTHKTLPAMGQSALLFTRGMDPELVRRRASIYGTSSPSYPILASIDLAREWLKEHPEEYTRTARRVEQLRRRFPSVGEGLPCDPTRLTLKVKDGPSFQERLEQMGIYPEMEDGGHVVLICTPQDNETSAFDRLEEALKQLESEMGDCPPIPAPPIPERVMSIREAMFAPTVELSLEECEGKVAACQLAPYPPGVPVVAPGERISKKELSYFKEIGYNKKMVQIISESV